MSRPFAVGPPSTHSNFLALNSLPNTLPGNMWHSSEVCAIVCVSGGGSSGGREQQHRSRVESGVDSAQHRQPGQVGLGGRIQPPTV
jgi:hypothetical protein